MTTVIENQTINHIQLSDTKYFSVDELIERLESGELNYCPERYYIRSKIQENSKSYRDALTTFDIDTGEQIYQILFAVTIFKENGKEYLINGNSRVSNFVSMYKAASESDKSRFMLVPYNYILNEPITEDVLLAFQKYANDTTIAHSVIDRLVKAEAFYKSQYAKYKKLGKPENEAKQTAQMDVRRALGKPNEPISQPQFSKVTSVAKACSENELLRSYIENEQIGIDAASLIVSLFKKITKKKGNENLSLDFVLISIMAVASAEGKKNDKGLSVIEPRHISAYEESLKEVKEVKDTKPKTIEQLSDEGLISEDLRGEIENLFDKHKEKITEKELVSAILSESAEGSIDSETVKTAVKNLKLEVAYIPISELNGSKVNFLNKVETIDLNQIHENAQCSKLVSKFCETSLKLLTKTNKYFGGSESKEILKPILGILESRVSALDTVLADAPDTFESVKNELDVLIKLIADIDTTIKANSEASTEEIEIDDEEIEIDDEDNADVFGDDEEEIEESEGGFTATVE